MIRAVHPTLANVNLQQDLTLYRSRVNSAELLRQTNQSLAASVKTMLTLCGERMQSVPATASEQLRQAAIDSVAPIAKQLLLELAKHEDVFAIEEINPIDMENPRFYMLNLWIEFLEQLVDIEAAFLYEDAIQEGIIVELIQSKRLCRKSDELQELHKQLQDNHKEIGEIYDEEASKTPIWLTLLQATAMVKDCIEYVHSHSDDNE